MLGRAIVHGRRARAHDRLGLVLGALVGVAERPGLAVVLVGRAAAVAGDVGGRHVGHALQVGYGAREVEHAPGALDVDRARLLDREVEGDRGRAVDDGPHAPRRSRRGARRAPGAARSGRRRSRRRGRSTGACTRCRTARRRESASASSAARTRQWTSWSAASRRASTAMPTKPVAPVSKIGRSVTGTGLGTPRSRIGRPGWRAARPAAMGSVHGLAARALDHWSSARRGRTCPPHYGRCPAVEMLKRG